MIAAGGARLLACKIDQRIGGRSARVGSFAPFAHPMLDYDFFTTPDEDKTVLVRKTWLRVHACPSIDSKLKKNGDAGCTY